MLFSAILPRRHPVEPPLAPSQRIPGRSTASLQKRLILFAALWSGAAHAALPVAVVKVQSTDSYAVTRAYGGEVRPRRASTLAFRHTGELQRIHVQEGDRVAVGALLAELDPELLEARLEQATASVAVAEASLAAARAKLELSEHTRARFAKLVDGGHVSKQRFDEVRLDLTARQADIRVAEAGVAQARANARLAQAQLDGSRIEAPYAGRIQTRFVDEGTLAVPGKAVLRIIEDGLPRARIGLPQAVALALDTDTTYAFRGGAQHTRGRLFALLPEVDDRTRTVTAVFNLEDSRLPIGSSLKLELERTVQVAGFWLPLTALSEAQRGLWAVYAVINGANGPVTERRLVEVLHTGEDEVFVQGTLTDGEVVVVAGTGRIVPGQTVVEVAAE